MTIFSTQTRKKTPWPGNILTGADEFDIYQHDDLQSIAAKQDGWRRHIYNSKNSRMQPDSVLVDCRVGGFKKVWKVTTNTTMGINVNDSFATSGLGQTIIRYSKW